MVQQQINHSLGAQPESGLSFFSYQSCSRSSDCSTLHIIAPIITLRTQTLQTAIKQEKRPASITSLFLPHYDFIPNQWGMNERRSAYYAYIVARCDRLRKRARGAAHVVQAYVKFFIFTNVLVQATDASNVRQPPPDPQCYARAA